MSIVIKENVPLAPLTTFGIGGPARYFVEARTQEELFEALERAREIGIPWIIWAGGSNVLAPDEGLDALVVYIALKSFKLEGNALAADSGCNLLSLIKHASQAGMGGWEKLAGIPGTLGGAVRGNAGAFGTEIKDVLLAVEAFNAATGEKKAFSNSVCDFSYRHSFFKGNPEWIILGASVQLKPAEKETSLRLIGETVRERERRHIQNVAAAGSYFMNPVAPKSVQEMFEREKGIKSRGGRVPAGWLIEKAGMKGAREGGAIASIQHPNYIVNEGSATARDVIQLAENIKKAVQEKFGAQLKEEAVVLG